MQSSAEGMRFAVWQGAALKDYGTVASSSFLANTWQHFVGVFDGDFYYFWQNGSLIGSYDTSASGIDTNANPIMIGIETVADIGGPEHWAGKIDEVRLYNRALSTDEIRQLYRMGALPRGIK